MPRIIFLHQQEKKIALNAETITWFEPAIRTSDKKTKIHLTSGKDLVVDESFSDVDQAIRKG